MKITNKIYLHPLAFLAVTLLGCGFSSFAVKANVLPVDDLPEAFRELYQYDKRTVEFNFSETNSFYLTIDANYDTIRLTDSNELNVLRENLEMYHISADLIDMLIEGLKVGIKNTNQCKGIASNCIVIPETYTTLFDYYTNKVYLWVNPEYLQNQEILGEFYAPSEKEQYTLINHFSAYAGTADLFDSYNFNIYDDTIVGLKHGYIDNRVTYNKSDNNSDFDLDHSTYNYEFNKYRLRAGYNATVDSFNSTDFLLNVNNTAELALDFGSSYNLAKQESRATQRIFYFAPRAGVLKVYRNNRIVLQRNVNAGQGYITNLDLPRGRYDIDLEVSVGDQVVSRESHAIFNTNDDKLPVGGIDYRLTAGVFKATDTYDKDTLEGERHQAMDDQAFGRFLASYRATDRILLASGFTGSEEGNSTYVGAKVYLPFDATLEAKVNYFGDKVFQAETYFNWKGLNFSYEQFENDALNPDDINTLATYYYGVNSYQRYSASYSSTLPFWNAYGYITYSYTDQQNYSSSTSNGQDFFNDDNFNLNVFSGGLRFPFIIDSSLDLSMNYSFSDSQLDDTYYASVMWTIPINQIFRVRSTTAIDDDGFSQFSTTAESSDLIRSRDDYYLSANVTNNYTPQNTGDSSYSSAGLSGQVVKDAFDANAYVYADTNGSSSSNLGFNSSQIVTENGVSVTRKKSNAYVKVAAENHMRENADKTSRGLLVLAKNGKYSNKEMLYKDEEVLPLQVYSDYLASLDVESTDLYNAGKTRVKGFAQPGTVMEMDTKISRVVTFVSGFKDIFDKDIDSLACHGEGCLTVQPVVEGVFKVSVLEGMSFGLQSGEYECMLAEKDNSEMMNFGNNYCLPDLVSTASMTINVNDEVMTLTYLGNYKKGSNFNSVELALRRIESKNVEVKKKEIANNIFVYVITKDGYALSAAAKSTIDELQKYANKSDSMPNLEYALSR